MKKTTKIKINHYGDREEMVCILARQGYHVWMEEKESDSICGEDIYFVCFES